MWPGFLMLLLSAAAAPAGLPWEALPAPPSAPSEVAGAADAELEMAVLVSDLRGTQARIRALLEGWNMPLLPAGAVGAIFAEIEGWLQVAVPGVGPVPAAVAWLQHDDQRHVSLTVRVAPGVATRLTSGLPAGWQATLEGDVWHIRTGQASWVARVEAGGWLQLAERAPALRPLGGDPGWLPDGWRARVQDFDMLWAVSLASPLGRMLHKRAAAAAPTASVPTSPAAGRAAALAWRRGACGSQQLRAIFEADDLAGLADKLGPSEISASQVDARALSFVSGVLPAGWLADLQALLGERLAGTREVGVGSLGALLSPLEGRFRWAHFGAPGDLALAAGTASPEAASGMAGRLEAWVRRDTSAAGLAPLLGRGEDPAMTGMVGAGAPLLQLLPESGLPGPVATWRQKQFFLAQGRDTLELLLSPPKLSLLAGGRLTPLMHAALAAPHAWAAYEVVGSDSTWLSWLLAQVARGGGALQLKADPSNLAGAWARELARGLRHQLADLYDAALLLDVEGSRLTLDLLTSDI